MTIRKILVPAGVVLGAVLLLGCAGAAPPVPTPSTPTLSAPSLPGTAVWLRQAPAPDDRYQWQVHTLGAGVHRVASLGDPQPWTNCSVNTPTLAPDQTLVAIGTGVGEASGGFFAAGTIAVVDLATGRTTPVGEVEACAAPIWTADSRALLLQSEDGCRRVELATGATSDVGGTCGYTAFAPDGGFSVQYPEVRDAAGTVVGRLPASLPRGSDGYPVQAFGVSVDGRFVALGLGDFVAPGRTDTDYRRDAGWLYDRQLGRFVELPELLGGGHSGELLNGVLFLADGGLLVSTGTVETVTWYLLAGVGEVTTVLEDAPAPIVTGQFSYLP